LTVDEAKEFSLLIHNLYDNRFSCVRYGLSVPRGMPRDSLSNSGFREIYLFANLNYLSPKSPKSSKKTFALRCCRRYRYQNLYPFKYSQEKNNILLMDIDIDNVDYDDVL